jgi:hypothetical protein
LSDASVADGTFEGLAAEASTALKPRNAAKQIVIARAAVVVLFISISLISDV